MGMKTNDPQVTVTGFLKEGQHGELICFNLRLAFFELACIVNIPAEGETRAPVYCKFKIAQPRNDRDRDDEETDKVENKDKG